MKHDYAYSKHFRNDIPPQLAYDYFHTRQLDSDEFRCHENCDVPVTLVNVRSSPDKWKVPPYFKYRSGYDGKHTSSCPNISKITKVSKRSTKKKNTHTYKPSEDLIINLSSSNPTPYEEVGTSHKYYSTGKNSHSYQSNLESPIVKHRSTRLSKLSSTVNQFLSHPKAIANFNGTTGPLDSFFYELRHGHYKLSFEDKIYHGKATAKKVKNKNGKPLILLEFEQKCQLDDAYFEKPAVFIDADVLDENIQQHQKLLSYCQSGDPFHLYIWGKFFVTSNLKIRLLKGDISDSNLLNNFYLKDWSE
ncbi:hypothetical protein SUF15_09900 [Streptococcus agalactiae]|uniref:hypothetical protein n=1 Tax=Streptococcus agalactiae TaxID=1311 RepID=UPI001374A966|nr:hypothetical protein [Streptococcus agalactiae]KAF1260936.1 hypothetical protein B8V75_04045 [Streptococcus agalactiae]KAF1271413.1 hypothetical protein B8V71_02675 [Streptococcus agalactiae]